MKKILAPILLICVLLTFGGTLCSCDGENESNNDSSYNSSNSYSSGNSYSGGSYGGNSYIGGSYGGSSGSSSSNTCRFKSGGVYVCNNKATRGQLCEYHFNYLDDIYNEFAG